MNKLETAKAILNKNGIPNILKYIVDDFDYTPHIRILDDSYDINNENIIEYKGNKYNFRSWQHKTSASPELGYSYTLLLHFNDEIVLETDYFSRYANRGPIINFIEELSGQSYDGSGKHPTIISDKYSRLKLSSDWVEDLPKIYKLWQIADKEEREEFAKQDADIEEKRIEGDIDLGDYDK